MYKMFILLLKFIFCLAMLISLLLAGCIVYATLTNYEPAEKEAVNAEGDALKSINSDTLSFFIWNVGYSGLGKESDFFYDGGKIVISPKNWVEKNINGVKSQVQELSKNTDFFMLQEVDANSKRSYYINQVKAISEVLPGYASTFAPNYNVKFVAFPFSQPMGKVLSGLANYSPYKSIENTRFQLPGSFGFPKRVFYLDRCMLLNRYQLPNNKQLVVINTHKEAYDNGGIKEQEMQYMKKIILTEYEKGNYVVVGGDWNQCPPNFDNKTFLKPNMQLQEQLNIKSDFMPQDWHWIYDPKVATNRKNDFPFNPETTFTTLIDFFLISPNIQALQVKGVSTGFDFSDHQGVWMKVKLN